MKKIKYWGCLGVLTLLCLPTYAQIDNKKTVAFLQGNELLEKTILTYFLKIKNYAYSHDISTFVREAQAIACVFTLIVFGVRMYEVIAGDKKLDVMPLLRPFVLAMVIMWWSGFTAMVRYPTDLLAIKTMGMFSGSQETLNAQRLERADLIIQVADALVKSQVASQVAADNAKKTDEGLVDMVASSVKDAFTDNILTPILEWQIRMQVGLQLLITQILEIVAIWILRIAVYVILLLSIVYGTVLVVLGPFSAAVSILPAFRDALNTWVARFIAVNLYAGIAYLVLYVVGMLQQYAMASEIEKYKALLSQAAGTENLLWFASNGILSFGTVIVSFVVSAIAVLTVPTMSTWIISTSGVTSAIATGGRVGGQMARAVFKR